MENKISKKRHKKKINRRLLKVCSFILAALIIILCVMVMTKGKKPEEYTKEEYYALSEEEQATFYEKFDDMDAYFKWYDEHGIDEENDNYPELNIGDKNPEDFTWEDYSNLPIEQQALFPDAFESMEDFEAWWAREGKQ